MTIESALIDLLVILGALASQVVIYLKLLNNEKKIELHRTETRASSDRIEHWAANGKTVVQVVPLPVTEITTKESTEIKRSEGK